MSKVVRAFFLSLAVCSVSLVSAQVSNNQTKQDHHSAAGEALPLPAASPTPHLISLRKPTGMILSTGNLYFTSHDAAGATVWRTSQTSIPGQETVLFWEAGAKFGDIVFAQVDGRFFGYFLARKDGVTTIRRVSLTGGPATVMATISNNIDIENSHRNLLTDGVNIYWQDDVAIRKIPIGGGPITVIDPSNPNTPLAGLAFQNGNIVYASVAEIRFVPPNGSSTPPSSRIIVTAASRVVSLHAVSNGVYWGDNNGAVKRKVGAATSTLQATGGLATSISSSGPSAGGTEAWTECSGSQCRLHVKFLFVRFTTAVAANPIGVTVMPGRRVFWGDAAGIHRRSF